LHAGGEMPFTISPPGLMFFWDTARSDESGGTRQMMRALMQVIRLGLRLGLLFLLCIEDFGVLVQ